MLVSSVTRCTLSDAVCGFPARPAERRPLCSQRLDRVRARRRGCPARGVPQALYVRRASSASSSTVLPAVCAFARSSANSSSETWMLFWFSIARSLSGNPSAPNRRPPSSAVSALVLSLTAPLLCAYLRVSAPPRQNHSLRFPNPIHHTQKIKAQMRQLIDHLREDVGKVTEPKAQALFETSAEVLTGLVKVFDDYEKKNEAAWRTEPTASRPKESTTNATR